MQTLHIRNFRARYRLTARERDERPRLDDALHSALDEMLEGELMRLGFGEREEVCIRDVFAPVRLRPSATTGAMAREWARALAAAIKSAADGGRTGVVVRYASRFQALVDMCVGVARDELERVWAWRQVGLWSGGANATRQEALNEAVAALFAEPQAIVPVLSTLAGDGTLARLAPRLTPEHWSALAEAALEAAGAPFASDGSWNQSATQPSLRPATTKFDQSDPLVVNLHASMKEARRIVSASRIARSLAASWPQHARVERAVAVLVVLESSPVSLSLDVAEVRALLNSVALAMRPVEALQLRETAGEKPTGGRGPGVERARFDEEAATTNEAEPEMGSDVARLSEASLSDAASEAPADLSSKAGRQESPTDAVVKAEAFGEERPLPDVRRRAFTRFGGLLFLLGLLEDLGLPEDLYVDAASRGRTLSRALHRLALVLAPCAAAADPAVLAFAGLMPDAKPPSEVDDEADTFAVEAYAARVVAALRERLEDRRGETAEALLEFVCMRRAEVVADPGWFEVRLSLEEVSTELRSAGLDLDPGYLRWLGVVVKFVYE